MGKRYRIGAAPKRPAGRMHAIGSRLTSPFRYLASTLRPAAEDEILWALRDVSFEVERGEVLGIIGPNGAGKSTLLKILSRITEPSEGRAELRGRVGSLLEVGTGFHPQLTGRENIYLSGAIRGMKRSEIDRKFDGIVAFAEIEKFMDTPVKRYSSGMYVRLAFAVAAHLEPEIMLVDEVLAVGDAAFQKKCLGKMGDVARGGRTIIFVSHNMSAVQHLCTRAILVESGRMAVAGNPLDVVNQYLTSRDAARSTQGDFTADMHLSYPPPLEIYRAHLVDGDGRPIDQVLLDSPMTLRMFYRIHNENDQYNVGAILRGRDETQLGLASLGISNRPFVRGAKGATGVLEMTVRNPLAPGVYYWHLNARNQRREYVEGLDAVQFQVLPSDELRDTKWGGFLYLAAQWRHR